MKAIKLNRKAKIAVVVVAVLLCLMILKNLLIQSAIVLGVKGIVGVDVKIENLNVMFIKQSVRIKGFQIMQPKGFPKGILIDIPAISVDFKVAELLKGKLHLPLIEFHMKEMVVIRNEKGELNVDSLKIAQAEKKDVEKEKPKKKSKQMPLQIDQMILKVEKVIEKDYTKGEPPVVKVYPIGLDKTYKDIKSAEKLATLIMVEAMGPAAIKGAKIYAAAAILGVGFVPVGIVAVLVGKDAGSLELKVAIEKLFQVTKDVVEKMGEIQEIKEQEYVLKAKISGSDVTIALEKRPDNKTKITVKARQMLLPKPEIAEGIIYEINKELE